MGSRLPRHPAPWALAGLILAWTAVLGALVWLRHQRFASFGFDLGIYDQAVWLLSHGHEAFVTVRGLHVFGHHVNLALLLLVPFYRLGAGPHLLNLLQVGTVALAAVPLFLLVTRRTGRPWVALGPAAAVLLHPSASALQWELFHPDTMAVTPLLVAYLAAVRERWGWYGAFLLLALAWKEDLALAGLMLGLVLVVRGHRLAGAVTAVGSLTWFATAVGLVIPAFNPAGPFYAATMFGDLGGSPAQVLGGLLTRPDLVWERMTDPHPLSYLLRLAGPFGLVLPLAAPLPLAIGLPQLAVNLLTEFPYARQADLHYAAVPFAAVTLAAAEAVGWASRRNRRLGSLAAVLVAGAALAGSVAWGDTPGELAAQIRNPRQAVMVEAVSRVPPEATVTATYNLVPHLSHREAVYEWPNPWRTVNWGVQDENPHDPGIVQWLVVDQRAVRPEDRGLLDRLLEEEFATRFEAEDVLVARRRE